ncbi:MULTISPECIES: sodium-dependent transporter [unclassified Campylobacter]|uniref:sodium-dependent transporter n=1 Tax=unclassified Campylobacter TaxID=2593542 RepID=UPI001237B04C|nr:MULTISPECIES: sodium-dependent transporter [unclassified Campylobacter]KAA6228449.1 sodium-dependent transporter [Campylobacter sp. LR185c]KAA6228936.1 sodium-dependent transporter [Campylobacter sp. LR196d]KAA6229421.1 sodium-dependent transporter [Campylobacter sp. LR286c]KAA6229887.1 sodium-dependent transporter [Campylobacter sp. LR264d]KAA6234100.1 sodium-dependent transporter [Campylobacter sp. LR291e]
MSAKFSKIGFILAVAGSAVGLGNAWKFPTLVGQNGGSAFILLYLVLTLCVSFVIFLAELSMGRLSEKDPVNAYKTLAPSHKNAWGIAGFMMIGAIFIVSFYSLVIAWILRYLYLSLSGNLPLDLQSSIAKFESFISQDFLSQILCFTIIFFIIFYVVSKGIKNGIERLNVWMMPSLFILLLFLLFYACSKDGFLQAFNFLFVPDFSKISVDTIVQALGLAFFSLSLGVGTIITYSASLPEGSNFILSTLSIIFINVLIGLLMGLVVFTFIFEFGADPTQSGGGLVFISLSTLFSQLGIIGHIIAALFFIALIFAGITSAVSMIEPFAFYLINSFKMSRKKALFYIGVVVYILGILCILSFLSVTNHSLEFFGKNVFDILDFLSSELIMPLGGICVSIFVGFVMKKEGLMILFRPFMSNFFFELWYFILRFIAPLAVIIVMIAVLIKS